VNRNIQHALLGLAIACSLGTLGASFSAPAPERIRVIQLRPIPDAVAHVATALNVPREPERMLRLRLSPAERVAAARLVVNEDSRALRGTEDGGTAGELTVDSLAILQVVHDFAAWTKRTHGASLRLLGPHVAGNKKAVRRRHAVYRTLPAEGLARPPLWRDEIDGPWQAYAVHWARLREAVSAAAEGGFAAPCKGKVITWGGEFDTHIALSRGLVRAKCAGKTVNTVWQTPAAYAAAWATGRSL